MRVLIAGVISGGRLFPLFRGVEHPEWLDLSRAVEATAQGQREGEA